MKWFLGFQVYQASSHTFLCHSKYAGRKLDEAGVRTTLKQFLHNGQRLRVELISEIVHQLESLSAALAQLSTFRFYSSSLLVMYDGGVEDGETGSEIAAQSNVVSMNLQQQATCSTSSDHAVCDNCSVKDSKSAGGCRVDVRMIDFAHATHSGFKEDRTRHSGPDRSYLFGLRNLISMFSDVKQQHESGL